MKEEQIDKSETYIDYTENCLLDQSYSDLLDDNEGSNIHELTISALKMNILLDPDKYQYRAMVCGKLIVFDREGNTFRIHHVKI